jgi:hypothetical protein
LRTLLLLVTVLIVLEAIQVLYPGTRFGQRPASASHVSGLHPSLDGDRLGGPHPAHLISFAWVEVERRLDEQVLPLLFPLLSWFVHYQRCYIDGGLGMPFPHHDIIAPKENALWVDYQLVRRGFLYPSWMNENERNLLLEGIIA